MDLNENENQEFNVDISPFKLKYNIVYGLTEI